MDSGTVVGAPQQVVMQGSLDLSVLDGLESLVMRPGCLGGRNSGKCNILDNANKNTVFILEYTSVKAQLKSADEATVLAEFNRPSSGLCQVILGEQLYATCTWQGGNGAANECEFAKADNSGGIKFGKGPCMLCCGPANLQLDDLNGNKITTVTWDNGTSGYCGINMRQRWTIPLTGDKNTKLDLLLMHAFLLAAVCTSTVCKPQASGVAM